MSETRFRRLRPGFVRSRFRLEADRPLSGRTDRLGIRRAGGAAYDGILLAAQAALFSALRDGPRVEGFYCRDSAKRHGAGGTLEGRVPGRGEDAALMAGFVCDGAPLMEAARLVRQTGAKVGCFLVGGLCGDCGADAASWGAPVYLVGGGLLR